MKKNILVAVAWPYVNGEQHIGHLAGYLLPADIFARYNRLVGNNVLMVSGSDCFGTPITIQAEKEGLTEKDIVKKYHERNLNLFKNLNLTYDLYTKTDTENHIKITQDFFMEMLDKDFIVKGVSKEFYDEKIDKFLPDRYVEGECPHCNFKDSRSDQCDNCGKVLEQEQIINPINKTTKNPVSLKDSQHYFVDWEKLQPFLNKYINENSDKWRPWVKAQTKAWLDEGLKKRAITRDISWGVEIPVDRISKDKLIDNADKKRIYVWFEAVLGYYSSSVEFFDSLKRLRSSSSSAQSRTLNVLPLRDSSDNSSFINNQLKSKLLSTDSSKTSNSITSSINSNIKNESNGDLVTPTQDDKVLTLDDFWKNKDAEHYYFMGKDNLVFHTLFLPGQLHAFNKELNLPTVPAINQFLNFGKDKFSKSRGVFIGSEDIVDAYGIDNVRFYITSIMPENKDSEFTYQDFVDKVNNILVANYSNLVSRSLNLYKKVENTFTKDLLDKQVLVKIEKSFKNAGKLMQNCEFKNYLNNALNLSTYANTYINDNEPWKIDDKEKFDKVMFNVLSLVFTSSFLLHPIIPSAIEKLQNQTNTNITNYNKDVIKYLESIFKTLKVQEMEHLFTKIKKPSE